MDEDTNTSEPNVPSEQEPARRDRDLYGWAVEQAALLRAGRIAEADAANIAQELDDVGNEQYDKLENALRIILLHLLKWDHQPRQRSRSWRDSILTHRNHAEKVLTKNPGLKPRIEEALGNAYADARIVVAAHVRPDERGFPLRCPYSLLQIMQRPIVWPPGA